MRKTSKLPKPQELSSWKDVVDIQVKHIKQKDFGDITLRILEAGCGQKWDLDLTGVRSIITGVDINMDALNIRKNQKMDLDIAILGDLRTVKLDKDEYDLIYSAFVLEHIDGAEDVLKNFVHWLKPGGLIILLIPDRNSTKGFLTRILPFWLHVFYKKHIQGHQDAGKPGHDPFPTFFDKVVSRVGIHNFCEQNGLIIKGEYIYQSNLSKRHLFNTLLKLSLMIVYVASFGRLSNKYGDLIFFIEKP